MMARTGASRRLSSQQEVRAAQHKTTKKRMGGIPHVFEQSCKQSFFFCLPGRHISAPGYPSKGLIGSTESQASRSLFKSMDSRAMGILTFAELERGLSLSETLQNDLR